MTEQGSRQDPARPPTGAEQAPRLDVHRVVTGRLEENSYVVVHQSGDAIVIDPGEDFDRIAEHLADPGIDLRAVLATHAHYDHVAAAAALVDAYAVPFYLHPADEPLLRRANFYRTLVHGEPAIVVPHVDASLVDREALRFGDLEVVVVHTPGHTHGSVCLGVGETLFTGDVLLAGAGGRTDLPGGDEVALQASIARLADEWLPGTRIHPGHGASMPLGQALAALERPAEAAR